MNRPMNNVMLDIETRGKKAGCPILSVAAVMFEPATGAGWTNVLCAYRLSGRTQIR
ncbi:MAG: 3'-5' exoribonuclease domain-containing protein [Sodalis sp. (in: enterobacteria)]|uniref:3'-5' exoribonuclease domain-containing protein n=1 Tax=Sodalis sp. (in: enterobacteria) TaxID=1898979 RepID=UPI003F3547CE